MISTIGFENIVYNKLKGGALVSAITGSLRKNERPINSSKEDVVINSLPTNNLQLQTGLVNVNIHVPNLTVSSSEGVQKVPNTSRLETLFNMAQTELDEIMIGDTYFDIQQQLFFQEEESSYINIRLDFYSINTN